METLPSPPTAKRPRGESSAPGGHHDHILPSGSLEGTLPIDGPDAKRVKLLPGAPLPTSEVVHIAEPSRASGSKAKAGHTSKPKRTQKGGKNSAERKRVRNRDEGGAAPGGQRREGSTKAGDDGSKQRMAKRKVALLISFCGTGCSGMQFQHTSAKTIEGFLFEALVKAGAISKDNSDHPAKVDLQRAARTDAGVHAAGNVVSLNMIIEPPLLDVLDSSSMAATSQGEDTSQPTGDATTTTLSTPEQLTATINSLLPAQIRLWSFLRTRGKFNARKECDSRRYEYLFPSWMLLPPKPGSNLAKMVEQSRADANLPPSPLHPFWSDSTTAADASPAFSVPPDSSEYHHGTVVASDLARKRAWRAEQATIDLLGEILKKYQGTHCFHNYTVGREFSDRAAQRYMMRVEVRGVNVLEGVEWVSVLFHGQSFMLHQIRKMISMAILTCRTGTPLCLIPETYGPRRIILPMAPALGLLLEQPVFESYNDRVKAENAALEKQKGKLSADEVASRYREQIDFGRHQEAIDKFKMENIYEKMRGEEAKSSVFDRWLRLIDAYQGGDLAYLNPKGTIPQPAIVKKGESRPNGLKEWKNEQRSLNLDREDEDDDDVAIGLRGRELEEMEG